MSEYTFPKYLKPAFDALGLTYSRLRDDSPLAPIKHAYVASSKDDLVKARMLRWMAAELLPFADLPGRNLAETASHFRGQVDVFARVYQHPAELLWEFDRWGHEVLGFTDKHPTVYHQHQYETHPQRIGTYAKLFDFPVGFALPRGGGTWWAYPDDRWYVEDGEEVIPIEEPYLDGLFRLQRGEVKVAALRFLREYTVQRDARVEQGAI